MKRGRTPLWLLRDLPALIGVVLSFWPLMIMVIANGRRAMLGRAISPRAFDCVMRMLPIAEAKLRFALHRQAYRALGWNPRAIALDPLIPVTGWPDFCERFQACRLSMMDLHAAATFFTNEHRRLYRIRTRVDANAVRASHASTDAARSAAAQHELVGVAASSSRKSSIALILSSDQRERPSKDEGVLTKARGPPNFPGYTLPPPQRYRAPENASACLIGAPKAKIQRASRGGAAKPAVRRQGGRAARVSARRA